MTTDYEMHLRRAEKGRRLSGQVTQHDNGFYVRSETQGAKVYNVQIENGQWHCTCDDFRYRSERNRLRFDFNCGHILACQYALKYGTVHAAKSINKTRAKVAMQQRGSPRRTYTTGVVPY